MTLAYWAGVQTLPPARFFSSWVLQDHRYETVDARVRRQVKDEGRQSPVRFLEYPPPLEGVAEALRIDPRRSQRVLEVYSLLALNLVRQPVSYTSLHPRDHHVLVVGGAGQYRLDLSLVTFVVTLGRR